MREKRTRRFRGFSFYERCIDGIRTRFFRNRQSFRRLPPRPPVVTPPRSSSRSSLASGYSVGIRYRSRPAGPSRQRSRHAMPRQKVVPPLLRGFPRQSTLPQWFLDNCVRTLDELRDDGNVAIIPLVISDGKGQQSHPIPERVDVATGSDDHDVGRETYEINRALWNVMLALLGPPDFSTPKSSDTSPSVSNLIGPKKLKSPRGFRNDAAHIRFPEARANGGNGFLLAVAQRLAREADAHLITLSIDDIDDFAEHFMRKTKPELLGLWENPLEAYFLHTVIENSSSESLRRELISHSLEFPFKTILSAGDKKASACGSKLNQERPVVVYIPHVDAFHGDLHRCILRDLRGASSSMRRQVLVLSSTNQALHTLPGSKYDDNNEGRGVGGAQDPSSEECDKNDKIVHPTRRHDLGVFGQKTADSAWEATILRDTGRLPRQGAICVAPIRSGRQRSFFDTNLLLARSHESANVRLVQRYVRRCSAAHAQMDLFQPYATWDFISGTPMQNLVRKEALDEEEAMQIASSIIQVFNEDDIKSAILDMGTLQEGLDTWCIGEEAQRNSGRFSGYSVPVQNQIREIEASKSRYRWENRFLSLLIAHTEVEEGITEIALDPDIHQEILQLVCQRSADRSAYGVLKNGRVGGALLYGPPGAGKTHLARILARESKLPFLSVSAADLMSKWIGETEKAIQGLFNLARMLAPSIIFVDEADALFMTRNSDERTWQRSKTNQLLQEMDGVRKSGKEPFVLLATNFPQQLDHAVLRRVPTRIFMEMPTCEQRLQILEIHLRDEILSDNVNLAQLSRETEGYTGSDIHTLCIQAALICDTFDSSSLERRRVLGWEHFQQALERTPATVSNRTLDEMKAFAEDFDPRALRKMMAQGGREEKKLKRHVPERRKREGQKQEQEQPTSTLVEQQDIEDHNLRLRSVEKSPLPTCEGEYKYTALAPNSKQIRVLYIHDKHHSATDSLLSCTIEIVDLDDKTGAWASFTSTKDTDPQCLLAQWLFLNVHEETLLKEPETFWLKPSSIHRPAPERPRPTEKVQSRYSWGDFITLSYVWGNPCSRRDILLNGHVFSITSNLYDALVHLRDSFEVRELGLRLWADAICINQQDMIERATEVKKMGLIYSQCISVRAWLGQPDAACIQHMQTLQNYVDEAGNTPGPLEIHWEAVEDFGVEEAAWVIGSALACLPYWERMWIIQEIVLAPTILFSFGASVFTPRQIRLVLSILAVQVSAGELPLQFRDDKEIVIQNVLHRLSCLRPEGPYGSLLSPDKVSPAVDLAHVLGMAQISKATDPRDKVFGLLALLPRTVMDEIEPDYRASFSSQDAIIMFSKAYLEIEGRLDLLVRMARLTEMSSDLPTWAFDLDWISHSDYHHFTKRPRAIKTQHANLNLAATALTFRAKDTTMLCQGIIVDAIGSFNASSVLSAEPSLADGISSPHNVNKFHGEREADSMLDDATYLRYPKDWRLALVRILMLDADFEFSEAPCVLDIPWIDDAEVRETEYRGLSAYPDKWGFMRRGPDDGRWVRLYTRTPLATIFRRILYESENLDIGGRPLRSYFATLSADNDRHPDTMEFKSFCGNFFQNHVGFGESRLVKTKRGLVGLITRRAMPGDKVVVLTQCDIPVVIRPKEGGKYYHIVGPCFIDGVMNGETAARGYAKLETFVIR